MAIPTSIQDLSPTDELNSPAGTDAVGGQIDNFFRAHAGIIRRALSAGSDLASASTLNLPPEGSYFYVTGTATINTITGGHPGRVVLLHLANNAKLANNANIITGTGGTITSDGNFIFVLVNVSANIWRVVSVEASMRAAVAAVESSITAFESRSITAGNGLTGGGTLGANRTITLGTPESITGTSTNSVSSTGHTHFAADATTTAKGMVELATDAEVVTGTDTTRAVTPSGLQSAMADGRHAAGPMSSGVTAGGGSFSGAVGTWVKAGASAYMQFVATKTWAEVYCSCIVNWWSSTNTADYLNIRVSRYNSTGVTRQDSGPEYAWPMLQVAGMIAITTTDVFTGLVRGTTYRMFLEGYRGAGLANNNWSVQGSIKMIIK